jgi:hypothetical protein
VIDLIGELAHRSFFLKLLNAGCYVFEIRGASQTWCAPLSRLTLQTADPVIIISREPFFGREREFLRVALAALGESRILVKDILAP